MTRAYQIENFCEVFSGACEQFEYIILELVDKNTFEMEHGQVEALIQKTGTELLRRLLQAHFDFRTVHEERAKDLANPEGNPLSHCRSRARQLMSLFGEVQIRRKGYGARGERSVFPLDCELNIPPDKYTHGLRRRVAEEVGANSFDEAVANIRKTTGGSVPKRQTEEISVMAAQDFTAFYAEREPRKTDPKSNILVMSVDQKGVVMHPKGLRTATRKAAEEEVHRRGARLSPGEKPNRKRMATVAAVYDIEERERSPAEVMGLDPAKDRPRAANKRVWASLERDPGEIVEEMFSEALGRDPGKKRPWAVVLDGAEKQLDSVLAMVLRHRPDASVVLDFIHVLEYVWKAAHAFHAPGSGEAEDWVGARAFAILEGEAGRIAREMRQSARACIATAKKREPVNKCAEYLEKYDQLLDYHEFLKKGLPIASGVIEGACRHLIKDRMDRTGARWGLERAEAVLKLRSLRSSGDFEAYWVFHLAKERERNHSHTYACCPKTAIVDAQNSQTTANEITLREAA